MRNRIVSIDILRGITIAGMILVNCHYGDTYSLLLHSKWNGITPCDMVFPFFLFLVGLTTYLSLSKSNFQRSIQSVAKIIRRFLLIFLLGLCCNWALLVFAGNPFDFEHVRFWGVLQRIAVCYGITAFFALYINHKYTLWVVFVLLVTHGATLVLFNGYTPDETNIAALIDNYIFGRNHLYSLSPVDPEGLLGTLSAIAHTLIGFYCGNIIQNNKEYKDKALSILIIGTCLFIMGYLFHYLLPLNKTIWSPSFAILTCGVAASLLGILIYVIDIKGKQNWSKPLLVFGINPLFLYLFSEFLNAFFRATGISECIFEIFNLYLNSYNSSLVYSLILVFLCWVIGYILYKKNIYIKI